MLISAIVPTYERYASLAECLATLQAQTLPRDQYEIIVVDNAPDRAESDRQAQAYEGCANLLWVHEPRPGVAHARNVGMWQARAPLVAYTEDDALVAPNWLAALVDAFTDFGESVHIVGGPVRPAWSAPQPEWLTESGMLAYLGLIDRGAEPRVLGDGEWVTGANLAYRIQPLRNAGGFATSLGRAGSGMVLLSNEETDLEERMKAAGGLVGWTPAATVRHVIDLARRDRRWFRRRAAWQAVSDFIRNPEYFCRHFVPSWAEADSYWRYEGVVSPLAALARDHQDPGSMHWEVSAIYHLMMCLLGGASEPDGSGQLG